MKFFVINSFRLMVYLVYPAFILYAGTVGFISGDEFADIFNWDVFLNRWVSAAFGLFLGWVIATLAAGLIITMLDIRDDTNDILRLLEQVHEED
ncbi:MAG: hypothetical protein CMK06_00945 [Ponticaulis sp.]|nr:hypothetical protein [Ponticaulis sp.]|tara:strand:- start:6640 stop:6921 length:282 start_codon:yes stop_codon:yes gene_type:complete